MSTVAIDLKVNLETTTCCACGVPFAAPDYLIRARRNDGQTLYCPNGHHLSWRETELDRVRKKLDEQTRTATQMAERAASAERAEQDALRSAQKANKELRRHQKRTAAGVCPCCNRTFQQLARHMKTKHPETTP
jgi:hypothetical protein